MTGTDDQRVFRVIATPWAHGQELKIAGVWITQTYDDDGTSAEDMVRDYLHAVFDRSADSFQVTIEYRESGSPSGEQTTTTPLADRRPGQACSSARIRGDTNVRVR